MLVQLTLCSGEDTNRGQRIRHQQGIPCQYWRQWESRGFRRKTCSHSKQIHSEKTFSSLNVIPWRESPHCLTQLVTWHHLPQACPKSTSRRVLNKQDEALWKSTFTIPAKVVMQEMWIAGLEYDELYRWAMAVVYLRDICESGPVSSRLPSITSSHQILDHFGKISF